MKWKYYANLYRKIQTLICQFWHSIFNIDIGNIDFCTMRSTFKVVSVGKKEKTELIQLMWYEQAIIQNSLFCYIVNWLLWKTFIRKDFLDKYFSVMLTKYFGKPIFWNSFQLLLSLFGVVFSQLVWCTVKILSISVTYTVMFLQNVWNFYGNFQKSEICFISRTHISVWITNKSPKHVFSFF